MTRLPKPQTALQRGQKTSIKVGEHFVQESIWGNFLKGISEDVK
jgi:hypothetical protein